MRKQKRQTVKKLMQCAAIIAAGVLAIILFMLAIWYIGKNSEPVTDEQVAAQMQQAEPLVIETPEAATEGSPHGKIKRQNRRAAHMERQRAPPKGREAENGSRGIDSRGRIPERLCRCHSRYA